MSEEGVSTQHVMWRYVMKYRGLRKSLHNISYQTSFSDIPEPLIRSRHGRSLFDLPFWESFSSPTSLTSKPTVLILVDVTPSRDFRLGDLTMTNFARYPRSLPYVAFPWYRFPPEKFLDASFEDIPSWPASH